MSQRQNSGVGPPTPQQPTLQSTQQQSTQLQLHHLKQFPIPPPVGIGINMVTSCAACHCISSPAVSFVWCHYCASATCKSCLLPQKREIVASYPVPICVRCSVLVKSRQVHPTRPIYQDLINAESQQLPLLHEDL